MSRNKVTKEEDLLVGGCSVIHSLNNSDIDFEYSQACEGYQPLEDNPNESKQKAINFEKINQFSSYQPGTELKVTGKFVIIKNTKKEVTVNRRRHVVIMEDYALPDHTG